MIDLVRITAPHFCAGLIMRQGITWHTAPILRYMRGWLMVHIRDYCARKGWQVEIL